MNQRILIIDDQEINAYDFGLYMCSVMNMS